MKRFTLVTLFLMAASAAAVPMYFLRARKQRTTKAENLRYDITDLLADETL
ncbi:MAG: hypothetical protein HY088_03305 [Ignavibacteriales bacterium]|nr:hypothetical protein [Ignavibacteriales bacterium]